MLAGRTGLLLQKYSSSCLSCCVIRSNTLQNQPLNLARVSISLSGGGNQKMVQLMAKRMTRNSTLPTTQLRGKVKSPDKLEGATRQAWMEEPPDLRLSSSKTVMDRRTSMSMEGDPHKMRRRSSAVRLASMFLGTTSCSPALISCKQGRGADLAGRLRHGNRRRYHSQVRTVPFM